jgi:hypothetical protein
VGGIEAVGGVGKGSLGRGCCGKHKGGWWRGKKREFKGKEEEREGKREGKGKLGGEVIVGSIDGIGGAGRNGSLRKRRESGSGSGKKGKDACGVVVGGIDVMGGVGRNGSSRGRSESGRGKERESCGRVVVGGIEWVGGAEGTRV